MRNENGAIVGLQEQERELRHDLADTLGALNAARRQEAQLREAVEVYGDRSRRPELQEVQERISTLEGRVPELEAEVLAVSATLGGIGRRDTVTARLQRELGLTDAQRESLKTALEEGATEEAVTRSARSLREANEQEARRGRGYSFNEATGAPW